MFKNIKKSISWLLIISMLFTSHISSAFADSFDDAINDTQNQGQSKTEQIYFTSDDSNNDDSSQDDLSADDNASEDENEKENIKLDNEDNNNDDNSISSSDTDYEAEPEDDSGLVNFAPTSDPTATDSDADETDDTNTENEEKEDDNQRLVNFAPTFETATDSDAEENTISTDSEALDDLFDDLLATDSEIKIGIDTDIYEDLSTDSNAKNIFGHPDNTTFYFKYVENNTVKEFAYTWSSSTSVDAKNRFHQLIEQISNGVGFKGFRKIYEGNAGPNDLDLIEPYNNYSVESSRNQTKLKTQEELLQFFDNWVDDPNEGGTLHAIVFYYWTTSYDKLYYLYYDINLPTDANYEFVGSRISIATTWEAAFAPQASAVSLSGFSFNPKIVVKGASPASEGNKKYMIRQKLPSYSTAKKKMKKLVKFNTSPDGSGTDFNFNFEYSNTLQNIAGGFTDNKTELTLYAIWEEVDIRSFNVCYSYSNGGLIYGLTQSIYSYDTTDEFYNKVGNIHFTFDGFYKIDSFPEEETTSNPSGYYDTNKNATMTKNEFIEEYRNWIANYDNGIYKNVAYGITQVPKIQYRYKAPTNYTGISETDWGVLQSRISDSFTWYDDMTDSTTSFDESGNFATNMTIKGNDRMYQSAYDPTSGKTYIVKLSGWTPNENGTTAVYSFNQTITARDSFFDWNTLALYPVWTTHEVKKMYINYLDDDNQKQLTYISDYDYTTYFDTIINAIPNYYDAFYDMGDITSLTTEDAIKNSYDPYVVGSIDKNQLKTKYTEWINGGATSNISYGATYLEKHFYVSYTTTGTNKQTKNENGFNNNIDNVISSISYTKLRGWYKIDATNYNENAINQIYNPDTTTDLITTDALKATFSNWQSKKKKNIAYGASTSPLQSISLKTGTTHKTHYKVDQNIDPNGLVIIPKYADGTEGDEVPYVGNEAEFSFSPALDYALTTSDNQVTVYYGTAGDKKSVSYAINVSTALVTEIKIVTTPSKVDYIEGQNIDPTGLVINVKYDDNTDTDVSYFDGDARFSFTPNTNTALAITNTQVTVSFGGQNDSYDITVREKQISSIERVANTPTKLNYFEGDSFDLQGLKIKVTYDNGTDEIVNYDGNETDFVITPTQGSVLNTVGANTITIKYKNDKTCDFDVQVIAVVVDSITIATKPNTTNYIEGQTLDVTGLKIKAHYNNNTENIIDYNNVDFTLNPANGAILNTVGNNIPVNVTYESCSATFNINVRAKQITGISLSPAPTKTDYYEGETIDPTGLQIVLNYDNGSTSATIPYVGNQSDISFQPDLSQALTTANTVVTVTYKNNHTATYNINVTTPPVGARVLESIKVATVPTKTTYNEQESFEPQGLVILASYSDSTQENISYAGNEGRFIFTPSLNTQLSYGNSEVKVLYNGKQTSISIVVNRNEVVVTAKAGGGGGMTGGNVPNSIINYVPTTHENARATGFYDVQHENVVDTYYRNQNGTNVEGWLRTYDAKWYLFEYDQTVNEKDRGKMIRGFRYVTDAWFFFNGNGQMATDFKEINNNTYYFETTKDRNEGKMATGWKKIGEKWYYFAFNGIMLRNQTTPDGYRVGQDGAWIDDNIQHNTAIKVIYHKQ